MVAIVLAGCASRATSDQAHHGRLTDQQFRYALTVAHREADRTARSITSATVTLGRGTVTDPNTGHRCLSGTELHVKLIGTFNIATGGRAGTPTGSTDSADDDAVHGVLITVDGATGQECLLSVQTGVVAPDHGATVLFT